MIKIQMWAPLTCAILTLGSCVSPTVYDTAQKVTDATQVVRDDYDKTTWIKSPLVRYSSSFDECFLRTLVADTGVQFDQLYVIYTASDWAFLERANDSAGRNLEVTVINRDVSSSQFAVSLEEHVAVGLDRSYLLDAAQQGIDIKIVGKSGSTVVQLPPHYIQGYVDRLNQYLDQL